MADTETGVAAGCLEKLKCYVKTRKGTILAAEISYHPNLLCWSFYGGYYGVAIGEMVFAIIFFVVFMMEMDKSIQVVNWVWSDIFRAAIGAALYLITSLICVTRGAGDDARIAGVVFGLLAGILFAYDVYTIILVIKSNRQDTAAPTGGYFG
uniref:Proteolipid protein 2 n=1 Tax=Salmo trutta TaxID=8032 RepID=A0A673XXE8_SALTR